jgi:hypothetical protein
MSNERTSNDKVYIHELIDIIGPNRAKYMHHMTANWGPTARDERDMLCFGVWGTVGSTGRWPEVVNLWELNGWDGLVDNFAHELVGSALQDPALATWWATAAELRRGGVDRIVVPEPWSPTIEELTGAGVSGAVYAHEIVRLPIGTVRAFLDTLAEVGVPALEPFGLRCVGAFRVAMISDTEAIVIWALPSWEAWGEFERAWDGSALAGWRARLVTMSADVRRTLMVDSPLSPMRTGRQPQIGDRRPLDEI